MRESYLNFDRLLSHIALGDMEQWLAIEPAIVMSRTGRCVEQWLTTAQRPAIVVHRSWGHGAVAGDLEPATVMSRTGAAWSSG